MPRGFVPPSELYPYHDPYESSYEGNRFQSWDDGIEPYDGYSTYESIGAGLDGPRSGYYGNGYEPFGVMEPNIAGPDDSMQHYSARYGYGVNRYGNAYDIPPYYDQTLRAGGDYGFNEEYRWPGGAEEAFASSFEYLPSENPWRDDRSDEVPPWHAARRIGEQQGWGPPNFQPAYGGEYGLMDFSQGGSGGYSRLEDDYYWR